jgi:hypothetical protein
MNRAKTSFSTEILTGAITSVVQYLARLRYPALWALLLLFIISSLLSGKSMSNLATRLMPFVALYRLFGQCRWSNYGK